MITDWLQNYTLNGITCYMIKITQNTYLEVILFIIRLKKLQIINI